MELILLQVDVGRKARVEFGCGNAGEGMAGVHAEHF